RGCGIRFRKGGAHRGGSDLFHLCGSFIHTIFSPCYNHVVFSVKAVRFKLSYISPPDRGAVVQPERTQAANRRATAAASLQSASPVH
ncbi:hypothetical protein XENOCAPTIV_009674, partial [Xenoophorus captivus]